MNTTTHLTAGGRGIDSSMFCQSLCNLVGTQTKWAMDLHATEQCKSTLFATAHTLCFCDNQFMLINQSEVNFRIAFTHILMTSSEASVSLWPSQI